MRRLGTGELFAVVTVCFGTSFVAIKTGVAAVPPLAFAALRYEIGAAVLLGYVFVRRGYWRPRSRRDITAVLVGGTFLVGLNGALLFVGQQFVTSGVAAVTFSLAPVLAPLFAFVVLPEERLDGLGAIGVLVGLVGVAVIVGTTPGELLAGRSAGQLLIAGAAASIAFGSVLLRRVGHTIPSLPMTAWSMVFAAVGIQLAALGIGDSLTDVTFTPRVVAAVLWVALPATVLAFPAYFGLIERAGPIRANLVTYAVPVVATVVGAVALAEPIRPNAIAGFLVIVAGFTLIERRELRREYRRIRGQTAPEPPDDHVCKPMPRG